MKNFTHGLKMVLVFLLCFAGHAAWAQTSWARQGLQRCPVGVPFVERSKADAPQTRGVTSEEWLNYAYLGNLQQLQLIGMNQKTDYNMAVYVPGDVAANATIDALEFYMAATNVKNVKIWASTTLPASPDVADLAVKSVAPLNLKFGTVNTQKFKTPVAIPEGGLYVGVSFDVTALTTDYDGYPVVFSELPMVCGGSCYVQFSRKTDAGWQDLSTDRYGLFLGARINGEFNESCVSVPATFPQCYVLGGTEGKVVLAILNRGSGEVKNISYKHERASGEAAEEGQIVLAKPLSGLMSLAYVEIPVPAGSEAKSEERTLTVTKVNGTDNPSAANVARGLVSTVMKQGRNVPAVEEFTGGWCGYCPMGAVALEMLNEKYGEDVVTIAVHRDDAMEIADYQFLAANSFPTALVNRSTLISPYYEMYVVDEAKQAVSPVSLALESEWADEAKTAIRLKATTTFLFSQDESSYALGYVLLHDGMKGTGSGWVQQNYFSGEELGDPNLDPLAELPAKITGYVYNHVAIAAWDAENGVEGSLPTALVADKTNEHIYTCKIDNIGLLQDKEKLTVAVLLIDRNTGKILNGAKSKISKYDPTAIKDVADGTAVLESIYTLTGQKVTDTLPGRIYLYKYADGKVLKRMAR